MLRGRSRGFFIMKKIALSQGKFAMVDDEDYEWLNQWKWCAIKDGRSFYAMRKELPSKKSVRLHRFILGVDNKLIFVDHEDGNGLNNQRSNLRKCTRQQNACNRKPSLNHSSQYLGVCWDNKRNLWLSQIKSFRKSIYLGHFAIEMDAASAYNEAAKKYHGSFARVNIIK